MRYNLYKRFLTTASILVVAATGADAATYNIAWTGNNGWTMSGVFSFDDALIGTGAIDASALDTFMIQVFSSGVPQHRWFYHIDGLQAGFLFNFNFDTTSETFLIGGPSNSLTGQLWNMTLPVSLGGSGPTTCPIGLAGFGSGNTGQGVCINGFGVISESVLPIADSTLTATRVLAPVPLPATAVLMALGLLGLFGLGDIARRRRARVNCCD